MIIRSQEAIPVSYLSLLISSEEYQTLINYMSCPVRLHIPEEDSAYSHKRAIAPILQQLSNQHELRLMFQLYVISGLLLSGSSSRQIAAVISCCPDYSALFPEIAAAQLIAGNWLPIPVIGIHPEKACIRYWIAGLLPSPQGNCYRPAWANNLMDTSARKAADDAAAAISLQINTNGLRVPAALRYENHAGRASIPPANRWQDSCISGILSPRVKAAVSFIGYPLALPNGYIQISGGSLGLSLALGYYELITGNALCRKMIASGTIGPTGKVYAVENIRQKTTLAANTGYQVFIYPSACGRIRNPTGLELAPVGCLEEAVLFAQLYAPGNLSNLILFQRMLKEPDLFLSACCQIDRQWLKWAGAHRYGDELITSLTKTPERAARLVERLAFLVENNRLQDALCLSDLITPRAFQELMAKFPATAFKWAVVNLSLCNHLGQTKTAAVWSASAEQMLTEFVVQDIADCLTYMNVHFIQLHHNHYIFRPELPAFLTRMLELIEKQHWLLCENGFPVNKTLAALYGSIAQNYGFCGPACLEKTEEFVHLAQQAFGSGRKPELDADWRRQFNYLAYAYLDAGDFENAKIALTRYLNIDSVTDIWRHLDHFSSWQHAILSRFIADVQDKHLIAGYLKWAQARIHALDAPHHPWQLWLLHLGRMAQGMGDEANACACYHQCVQHCLSGASGPTVQVMALTPLAYWRQLSGANIKQIAIYTDRILNVAKILNPEYFKLIFNNQDALSAVAEDTAALFPFSYR